MTGALDEALAALLRSALPALFGGGTPLARVAVAVQGFALDATSVDAEAGQPRSDAASDLLPFDAAAPQGPYTVTRPPDESLRLVRLATAAGDRIALKPGEVLWDPADARRFTLALRPDRDLAAVSGVLVLYGVTAVFANLKYTQDLAVVLESSDPAALERAQALSLAVLALHRPALVEAAAKTESADAYGAEIVLKALHFVGGDVPAAGSRRLTLRAEFELKAVRALGADEGRPIRHIRSPGRDGGKPVDIGIGVDG